MEMVEGQWIKLAGTGPLARGMSRYVELSKVASVDGKVHLATPALRALGAVGGTLVP